MLSLHHSKLFLNPGIAIGKTTLLCGYTIGFACEKNEPVVVLNINSTLLHRDYKRVKRILNETDSFEGLTIEYYDGSVLEERMLTSLINFMVPQQLLMTRLPQKYHLIIDEFHNCFFNAGIFELLPIFNKAMTLMAMSGSPLEKDKINFIQEATTASCVVLFKDEYPFNC